MWGHWLIGLGKLSRIAQKLRRQVCMARRPAIVSLGQLADHLRHSDVCIDSCNRLARNPQSALAEGAPFFGRASARSCPR